MVTCNKPVQTSAIYCIPLFKLALPASPILGMSASVVDANILAVTGELAVCLMFQ